MTPDEPSEDLPNGAASQDPPSRIRRILFVDDEERVLMGIQRQLRAMRKEWDVKIAIGGEEALSVLEKEKIDVVVSDMRMPGMDGAEFLERVMTKWPRTVRIILSGQADRDSILRSFASTHQYLAKPCDPDRLRGVVGRACALRDILYDQHTQALVSAMETIPSLPHLYQQIHEELRKAEPSVKAVGDIVAMDPGMSAKLLQIVNSARFGLNRQINSGAEAVHILGISTVKSLVLSSQVFTEMTLGENAGLNVQELWRHALDVGLLAKRIARDLKLSVAQIDMAFTAGLLHDCGRAMLAVNYPDAYGKILRDTKGDGLLSQKEQDTFEIDHAAIGAYLLGLWGLPEPIVEAVAFHHRPTRPGPLVVSPLVAVHIADALVTEGESREGSSSSESSCALFDSKLLEMLKLADSLDVWREDSGELREKDA
jgi:putative nucleotidyltransferase with HDIG domain